MPTEPEPPPKPCQGDRCRKPALRDGRYCRDCRDFVRTRLLRAGAFDYPVERRNVPRPGSAREDTNRTKGVTE